MLAYMASQRQGQNMQYPPGCCAQDPLYSVHFMGPFCSPEITPHSTHCRSNLGSCCAAAVESSSILWVVAKALLYLSEKSGLIAQCRRPPHF